MADEFGFVPDEDPINAEQPTQDLGFVPDEPTPYSQAPLETRAAISQKYVNQPETEATGRFPTSFGGAALGPLGMAAEKLAQPYFDEATVGAQAAAGLSGATLGASDYIMARSDPESYRQIKEQQQQDPWSTLVATGAGGMLLPGPQKAGLLKESLVLGGMGGGYTLMESLAEQQAKPEITAGEVATKTAIGTGIGMALPPALRGAGKLLGPMVDFAKNRMWTPTAEWTLETAEKLGIPVTLAEATQSRPVAQLERSLEYFFPSAGTIQKQRVEQLKTMIQQRERLIAETGGDRDIEEVGKRISRSIEDILDAEKISNLALRDELKNSFLKKLGSADDAESIGQAAKEAIRKRDESVKKTYGEAMDEIADRVRPGNWVIPEGTKKAAQQLIKSELAKEPAARNRGLISWLDDLLTGKKANFDPKASSAVAAELLSNPLAHILIPPEIAPALQQLANKKLDRDATQQLLALVKSMAGKSPLLDRASSTLGSAVAADLAKSGYDFRVMQQMATELFKDVRARNATAGAEGGMGRVFDTDESRKLQILWNAMRGDTGKFMKRLGTKWHNKWKGVNALYREWKPALTGPMIRKLLKPENEAQIIDIVYRPNNLTGIRRFNEVVDEKVSKRVGDKFVRNLVESSVEQGTFSGQKLGKQIEKYGYDVIQEAIGHKKLQQLIQLAEHGTNLERAPIGNDFFKTLVRRSPEKVVDYIVRPHNTANIQMLRSMGEEHVQDVAAAFLENKLKLNALGQLTPSSFQKILNQYGENTLRELLGPTMMKDFSALAEIGSKLASAERMSANFSGTTQTSATLAFLGGAVYHPIRAVLYAVGARKLAKALVNPKVRNWMILGAKQPGPAAVQYALKIADAIGAQRPAIQRGTMAGVAPLIGGRQTNSTQDIEQQAIAMERADHPSLPESALRQIVQDEMRSDREGYLKDVRKAAKGKGKK